MGDERRKPKSSMQRRAIRHGEGNQLEMEQRSSYDWLPVHMCVLLGEGMEEPLVSRVYI
jgi:hypothetical protein